MPNLILDYRFDKPTVTHTDGNFSAHFDGATVGAGPPNSLIGPLDKCLDLGATGSAQVDVATLAADLNQFCLRVVFRCQGPVGNRQDLVQSDGIPFALFVDKGDAADEFQFIGAVKPKAHRWAGPDTRFKVALKYNTWYTVTLAYDVETAALFIDDGIVGVYAFPNGVIEKLTGHTLYFGTGTNPEAGHFAGSLAAFQWYAGIPADVEAALDERRTSAEWFVTYRREMNDALGLGIRTQPLTYDAAINAYLQPYEHGALMYHDAVGTAFMMSGPIYQRYQGYQRKGELGYLVSDEGNAQAGGRKNVFSRGAIYWSAATGAFPVLGQLYVSYEALGASPAIGLPAADETPLAGGREQKFQSGRMYHKNGAHTAHEVRGPILTKFVDSGGTQKWGFPVSDQCTVMKGISNIGKFADFERCSIYWTQTTGAHEVHGLIQENYIKLKGPAGDLGFPTSDEKPISGATGTYNTFQRGSLLHYGTEASVVRAYPFRLRLGRVDTKDSEGFGMGSNDLYFYFDIWDGSSHVYDKRLPSSGDWGGDIRDVNTTAPTVFNPGLDRKVTFRVKVYDADPGGDDHLGDFEMGLDASNAWGFRINNGVFQKKNFSKIDSITVSALPDVNPATLTNTEMFWGANAYNRSTPEIAYSEYASAFADVDDETEWYDVTDWVDKLFYELVVEDLASGGNCFGMSLEAIYSRKGRSAYGLPLNRFNTWSGVEDAFNIRHCYQVGYGAINWFLAQFVTGNTHDPKDVFKSSRLAFQCGQHPVICLAKNYTFTGAAHAVLPVAWNDSVKPWRMTISDPNDPQAERVLTVDPDNNEFEYKGVGNTYSGSAWTGGRLHYIPYSVMAALPYTPLWNVMQLLFDGTIAILGDDTQTSSITDLQGKDLDAHGARALAQLQSGQPLDDYFVRFQGWSRDPGLRTPPLAMDPLLRQPIHSPMPVLPPRAVRGEVLIRHGYRPGGPPPKVLSGATHLAIDALAQRPGMTALAGLTSDPALTRLLQGRSILNVLADEKASNALSPEARRTLQQAAASGPAMNFIHNLSATRDGTLRYAVKRGLTEFRLESGAKRGETATVKVENLGTSKTAVQLQSASDRLVRLEVTHRLGAGGDRVRVIVDGLPVKAGAPLDLNLRPGLGGTELVLPGQSITVPVTIELSGRGRAPTSSNFQVPVEGGVRVNVATALRGNVLQVSRIDRLFGQALGSKLIQP